MNIALVCNEYPPRPHGGIGTFVYVLAHGLARRGHDVTVVGIGDREGERDDDGVRVVTFRGPRRRTLAWLGMRWPAWQFLRREAVAGRVDLIEVPDFLGMLPLAVDHCPVVVRLHNTATAMARHAGRRPRPSNWFFERRQLRAHRNWIAVSRHALDLTVRTFPSCEPDRYEVIYSPVTGAATAERPAMELPDDFVLHVGHLVARKGVVVLAEAARQFLSDFPDVHLVYAGGVLRGEDVDADHAIRRVLGRRLAERCHFLGHVDRLTVLGCMRRARALAFPSTLEMFPMAVIEAMAEECPVVASDIPPFPEFIRHGETGLLIDPSRPAEVAGAVSALLQDRSLSRALAGNAKAFVAERCSLDAHLDATLSFYRRCRVGATAAATAATQLKGLSYFMGFSWLLAC